MTPTTSVIEKQINALYKRFQDGNEPIEISKESQAKLKEMMYHTNVIEHDFNNFSTFGSDSNNKWNCDKCPGGKEIINILEQATKIDQVNTDLAKKYSNSNIQTIQTLETSLNILQKELNYQKLKNSETQKIAKIGDWDWNIITNELFWSDQLFKIFELDKTNREMVTYDTFISYVHPEDRDYVNKCVEEALAGNEYDIIHRMIVNDRLIYVNERGKVYFDEGKPVRMIGTAQDITEKYTQEEEYKKVFEAVEASSSGLIMADLDQKITYANNAAATLWGYDSVKDLIKEKTHVKNYWLKESFEKTNEVFRKAVAGSPVSLNDTLTAIRKDGSTFKAERKASCIDNQYGNPIAMMAWINDVTEQIEANDLLKKNEQELSMIFNAADDMMGLVQKVNDKFFFKSANKATLNILEKNEVKIENYYSKDIEAFFKEDLLMEQEVCEQTIQYYNKAFNEKEILFFIQSNKSREGRIYTKTTLHPIIDDSGQCDFLYYSTKDLTKHIEHEKEIEKLSSVAEKTGYTVIITDHYGKVQWVNNSFENTTGYKVREILGKNPGDLLQGPGTSESEKEKIMSAISKGERVSGEILNYRKNGDEFWYDYDIVPVMEEGKPIYYISTQTEITKRKELEKELSIQLQEKEILLAEVHHRVKNNLQVINGLLDLQIKKIDKDSIKAELLNTKSRINSIAIIHEKLYRNKNFDSIKLDQYLYSIINENTKSLSINKYINLKIEIEPIKISMDLSVPLGLMLNEIISNAFKHAFKNRKQGNLQVDIKAKNLTLEINIFDDGVGFKRRKFSQGKNSIGLKLIEALSSQIDAKMEITSRIDIGTAYHITIPLGSR